MADANDWLPIDASVKTGRPVWIKCRTRDLPVEHIEIVGAWSEKNRHWKTADGGCWRSVDAWKPIT